MCEYDYCLKVLRPDSQLGTPTSQPASQPASTSGSQSLSSLRSLPSSLSSTLASFLVSSAFTLLAIAFPLSTSAPSLHPSRLHPFIPSHVSASVLTKLLIASPEAEPTCRGARSPRARGAEARMDQEWPDFDIDQAEEERESESERVLVFECCVYTKRC